ARDFRSTAFVLGICIGMQKADRQRLYFLVLNQPDDGGAQVIFVQLNEHITFVIQPFDHFGSAAALDQRRGELDAQIIEIVTLLLANVEGVPESLRDKHACSRTPTLEESIGNEVRAMDDL